MLDNNEHSDKLVKECWGESCGNLMSSVAALASTVVGHNVVEGPESGLANTGTVAAMDGS